MVARHASSPWTYLRVKISKVKVNRLTNTYTVNAQYLPNGKAYELQILFTDAARRQATNAVTPKVKGQSRKVTWRVWQVLGDKSRTKRPKNTKIAKWHRESIFPLTETREQGLMHVARKIEARSNCPKLPSCPQQTYLTYFCWLHLRIM